MEGGWSYNNRESSGCLWDLRLRELRSQLGRIARGRTSILRHQHPQEMNFSKETEGASRDA